MFNIEQLMAPIAGAHPCGEDLAFSPEIDAITKARQADDPSLEQGEWVTPLKEADWKFVAVRCAKLIETRSKDLQLAVWLAEALAKTNGLRGLGEGLAVVVQLCERFWDGVHPQPDEAGYEQRIGNLCWIAARLPQLIREVPLTEGGGGMSTIAVEAARGSDGSELEAARRKTSRAFYVTLLADVSFCSEALSDLEAEIDERLGADGPSLSAAKSALEAIRYSVAPYAREAGVEHGGAEAANADEAHAGAHAPGQATQAAQTGQGGLLQTRAQALAQLRQVAAFFRRTEPHSPVGYLADKAASWGDQSLHLWLRGVVKDPAALAQMEELLGCKTAAAD
jgi:type VI secretion system protein ImpA